MNNQVICEHPRFLLNPRLPELLAKYHHYFLADKECWYMFSLRSVISFNKRDFLKYIPILNHDNYNNYLVVDDETGITYNIFLEVPCGECSVCKERKAKSFVNRCRLESQMYDCCPWFFTLTYSDGYLPGDGVSVRDVQLFMKRFRINLVRRGYFAPIRYCIVSEYGSKTHRAHYHGIIWNLKPRGFCSYKDIEDCFNKSWYQGFNQHRIIDLSDNKSFYYTSKYLRKDCKVPDGCNPTFMLSSRKNGGIGAPFLRKISKDFNRRLDVNFKFLDVWTNKVTPLKIDKYVLDKLLPSYCQVHSSSLRSNAMKFMYYQYILHVNGLGFLYQDTFDYLVSQGYFFKYDFELMHTSDLDEALFKISDYERKIRPFRLSSFDIRASEVKAQRADNRRNFFLSKFFLHAKPVDITLLGYSARRSAGRAMANEQL